MTVDPHTEIRNRIVRRLKSDEWMNTHFGIACHAGDVADAVLELFETIAEEHFTETNGVVWPSPIEGHPTKTRLVLRTAPEVA